MSIQKCKICKGDVLKDGLCRDHYRQKWIDRWHPKNGSDGLKNFLFDCYPDIYEPKFGYPEHMNRIVTELFNGMVSNKSVLEHNLVALFLFREAGKSSNVAGAVAYGIGFKLFEFICYRGLSMKKAQSDFMQRLKNMISPKNYPLYTLVFGEMLVNRKTLTERNTETEFITRNGIKGIILGAEQESQGSLGLKRRPQLFIWDDLESIENTKTEETRGHLYRKIFSEDIPACDSQKSFGIYLGTPKHREGMMKALQSNNGFRKVEHWLYRTNPDGSYQYDERGMKVPTWPEKFPLNKCQNIYDLFASDPGRGGLSLYYREYEGKLDFDEDRSIRDEWIQYCECDLKHQFGMNWVKVKSINGEPVERDWQACNVGLSVDPATSQKAKSCDTGGVLMITTPDGMRIIYRIFYGKYQNRDVMRSDVRMGYYEVEYNNLDKIQERGIVGETYRHIIRYKPDYVVIEGVGNYDNIRKEVLNIYNQWYVKNPKFGNHRFKLYRYLPVGNVEDKVDRILNYVKPECEAGNFYLNGQVKVITNDEGQPIGKRYPMQELKDQLLGIATVTNKDLADALHFNIIYSRIPREVKYEDKMTASEKFYVKPTVDVVTMAHGQFI